MSFFIRHISVNVLAIGTNKGSIYFYNVKEISSEPFYATNHREHVTQIKLWYLGNYILNYILFEITFFEKTPILYKRGCCKNKIKLMNKFNRFREINCRFNVYFWQTQIFECPWKK